MCEFTQEISAQYYRKRIIMSETKLFHHKYHLVDSESYTLFARHCGKEIETLTVSFAPFSFPQWHTVPFLTRKISILCHPFFIRYERRLRLQLLGIDCVYVCLSFKSTLTRHTETDLAVSKRQSDTCSCSQSRRFGHSLKL